MKIIAFFVIALGAFQSLVFAEVSRVEVERREAILDGRAFGLAGAYEKISGTIHFELDPKKAPNQIITDIEWAPTNDAGRVEFSTEFFLLKPKDIHRGNGAVLLEVGNRGRKGLLSFFNRAEGSTDPVTEAHFGDGLLLREDGGSFQVKDVQLQSLKESQ